jgi:hypothetical protein
VLRRLRDGANKLDKNSAYRQIVDDGLLAQEQHTKLTDPVDQHDWLHGSLGRRSSRSTRSSATGLSVLATVGSTAPFIGLFGTVIGIYRALVKIGAAGQASIDAVAGPVGEALIMTASVSSSPFRPCWLQLAAASQQGRRRADRHLLDRSAWFHGFERRGEAGYRRGEGCSGPGGQACRHHEGVIGRAGSPPGCPPLRTTARCHGAYLRVQAMASGLTN